jgi:hypothetical protein
LELVFGKLAAFCGPLVCKIQQVWYMDKEPTRVRSTEPRKCDILLMRK